MSPPPGLPPFTRAPSPVPAAAISVAEGTAGVGNSAAAAVASAAPTAAAAAWSRPALPGAVLAGEVGRTGCSLGAAVEGGGGRVPARHGQVGSSGADLSGSPSPPSPQEAPRMPPLCFHAAGCVPPLAFPELRVRAALAHAGDLQNRLRCPLVPLVQVQHALHTC